MVLGKRFFPVNFHNRKPFFNQPTGVALRNLAEIYISDGYSNFFVHKFSPKGESLKTWGGIGNGPGQFLTVHKLGIDHLGRVYVCARPTDRIQIFTSEGEYISCWTDFVWPMDVFIE